MSVQSCATPPSELAPPRLTGRGPALPGRRLWPWRGLGCSLPSNQHFPSVPRIGGNETQSRRRGRPISLRSSRVCWPRACSAPQPATGPPSPAASCGHGAPSHGVAWAAPSPLTSVWTLPLLLLATACRLICLCCFVFPVQAAAKRTTT